MDWFQEVLSESELVVYGTVDSRSYERMNEDHPAYNIATLAVHCVLKNPSSRSITSLYDIYEEDPPVCGSNMQFLPLNASVIASIDGRYLANKNMQQSVYPATQQNLQRIMQVCGFQSPSGVSCPNVVDSCIPLPVGAAETVMPSLVAWLLASVAGLVLHL